jgi:hypothetical protein
MEYDSESYSDTAVEDMAACKKVMTVLAAAYPDHPFMVGCDHFARVVHCRLMYDGQVPGNKGYGFLLYLTTIHSPDGDKRIRTAGGECLERFGLARGAATEQSAIRAMQHGINIDGIIEKSRY